jgi:uncharacterized protein YbaA (DUF1428 family)
MLSERGPRERPWDSEAAGPPREACRLTRQEYHEGADMMMTDKYVDGFVLPVPAKNIDAYKQFSAKAGAIWKEHGALEYIECVADDVKAGKVTSFPQAVKLEADEVVVFSWIVYQSREDRDRINAAVMSDSRLKMDPQDMPFDGKRLFWGGFKVLLAL